MLVCHLAPLMDAGQLTLEGLVPRGTSNVYKVGVCGCGRVGVGEWVWASVCELCGDAGGGLRAGQGWGQGKEGFAVCNRCAHIYNRKGREVGVVGHARRMWDQQEPVLARL